MTYLEKNLKNNKLFLIKLNFFNLFSMKNKGFTLIELIVVITILSILWTIAFISFKWYSSDARDSVRMTAVNQISTWLSLILAKNSVLPTPENVHTVTHSWKVVSKIWVVWENISSLLKASGDLKDPSTWNYYDYSIESNSKKYSVLARYEWSRVLVSSVLAEDLSENYISYWTSPWFLINSDGTSISDDIDIWALTNEQYKLISSWKSVVVNKDFMWLFYSFFNKNTLKNDSSLLGYWDMETTNSNWYIENLNWNGNFLKPVLWDNKSTTTYLNPSENDFDTWVRGKALNQTRDNNDLSDNYCSVTNTNLSMSWAFTVSFYVKRILGTKYSEEELFTNNEVTIRTLPQWEGWWSNEYQAYNPDLRSWVTSNHTNWDNVVVTSNNVDNFSIYVNGELKKSLSVKQYPLTSAPTLTKFWCWNRNTNKITYVYNWLVDEVAVWNRALSTDEIKLINNKFPQ